MFLNLYIEGHPHLRVAFCSNLYKVFWGYKLCLS